MTKSASKPSSKSIPAPSTSSRPWLLIFIFRLLLLGVGGGLALLVGIVLGAMYPSPNPEPPLLLKILPYFGARTPGVSLKSSPTAVSESVASPVDLTPVQRQQAQAQLNQLQGQMKVLSEQVATLENQLGSSRPNESVEKRLQAIALQLQGVKPPNSNSASPGNNTTNQTAISSDSQLLTDKLKVTLPSDVLFDGKNSLLRPEAGLILDKIIADLRNYPSSTIRITAHTDAAGEVEDNRELSFRRAKALEQYFGRALGEQYRWLVVGYGETRPLVANDTEANLQRNRRIEIAVE
ncbi:MAG TPA: cell envelope biogenesis protein OmpA [Cyanobacteria bacterium UBA11370]|nr:cell envelope biogenesis protein OmpA [Cyanobacteria bacterium UBA11370]